MGWRMCEAQGEAWRESQTAQSRTGREHLFWVRGRGGRLHHHLYHGARARS